MKDVKMLFFGILIFLGNFSYGQNYQRPGSENLNISTLKWEKTGETNFRLYYKTNGYTFNLGQDFRYFSHENGDVVIYCLISNCYWQLNEFNYAPKNLEMDITIVTCGQTVFVRSVNGGFWIRDRGLNVTGLQLIQFNPDGTAVYWSSSTGKKYWIPSNTYNYGSFNKAYKITSE